jgi:hypothetical protein
MSYETATAEGLYDTGQLHNNSGQFIGEKKVKELLAT